LAGANNPVLQGYVAIEGLAPHLLWYVARSHYQIMHLLGGAEARLLMPNGEDWHLGILRLAAVLDVNVVDRHWQLDLATYQPPCTGLGDDVLVEIRGSDQEPKYVRAWLAEINECLHAKTPEIWLFRDRLAIEVLEPGHNWQSGTVQLQLALVFTPSEPPALPHASYPAQLPDQPAESGLEPCYATPSGLEVPTTPGLSSPDSSAQVSIGLIETPASSGEKLETLSTDPGLPSADLAPQAASSIDHPIPIEESLAATTPPTGDDAVDCGTADYSFDRTLQEFVSDLESLSVESLPELGGTLGPQTDTPIPQTAESYTLPQEPSVSRDSTDEVLNPAIGSPLIPPSPSSMDVSAPDVITLDMFRAELPVPAESVTSDDADLAIDLTLATLGDDLQELSDLMPNLFQEVTLPPLSATYSPSVAIDDTPTLEIFEQELSDAVESVLRGSPDAAMSLAEFAELVAEAHADQPTIQKPISDTAPTQQTPSSQPDAEVMLSAPSSTTPSLESSNKATTSAQQRIATPDVRIVIDPNRSLYASDRLAMESLAADNDDIGDDVTDEEPIAPMRGDRELVEGAGVTESIDESHKVIEESSGADSLAGSEQSIEELVTESPEPLEVARLVDDELILPAQAVLADLADVEPDATIVPLVPSTQPATTLDNPDIPLPCLTIDLVGQVSPDDRDQALLRQIMLARLPHLQVLGSLASSLSSNIRQHLQSLVTWAWQVLEAVEQESQQTICPTQQSAMPLNEWMSYLLWQVTRSAYSITQLVSSIPAYVLETTIGWVPGRLRLLITITISADDQHWLLDLSTGRSYELTHLLAPGMLIKSDHSDILHDPQRVDHVLADITDQLHRTSPLIKLLMIGTKVNIATHNPCDTDMVDDPTWQPAMMRLDMALELLREAR
ncbi:MAG: hypothetical protein NZ772_08615, partial [Cyanobacteria bacterium]|nr:hypothetical protein [Cyanobacteriota bacterium]MDW8201540.1 hypothetical protein [Cyanobacteriota bacterium SKYGB_h_bin112]